MEGALGAAVGGVRVLDKLRPGDAEREGPGVRVAVGVARVGEDVAERDPGGGHAGQHGGESADRVGMAGGQGDPPGQFRDGRAGFLAGHRGGREVVPEEHLPFGSGQVGVAVRGPLTPLDARVAAVA